MKRIILTGGGTAGHVTPNIALIPKLRELGYDIQYIGSYNGIEKELIEPFGIPYHGISSGKLRRYFSLQNFTDPFRVIKGFGEARKLIKGLKPDVIFSKGGFVSVPVVLAGKRCKVPVIIHESDMTPGLANKLAIPSAVKVCCSFIPCLFIPQRLPIRLTPHTCHHTSAHQNQHCCQCSDYKLAFLLFADDFFMPLVVFVILNLIEKLFFHLIRHCNIIQ